MFNKSTEILIRLAFVVCIVNLNIGYGGCMQRSQMLGVSVLVASVLVAGTFAMLTIQKDIHGSGSIKGVGLGIYSDLQCTNATSSIAFGLLEAGSSKDFTLYLRNEGNADLTLNMTSKNWDPIEATEYMSLTWNREEYRISPGQVISFVITLSVLPNIQGISSFGLDITISGTG